MMFLSWLVLALLPGCLGYAVLERGQKYSGDESKLYLVYMEEEEQGRILSAWHDVPLFTDHSNLTYNMIVEIPRFSQAKFEISRARKLNPIVQDIGKDSQPRYLPNVFPWHGHLCNYGAFPQTWENPFHTDPWTGLRGDRDPIDVCEIGTNTFPTGTVLPVKVLGILGLIDRGETDWKVLTINAMEAAERNVETIDDIVAIFPDLLDSVRKFFRVYKVPDGNSENKFAFDGEFRDADFAKEVIRFTHDHWEEMMRNCSVSEEFSTANTGQGNQCSLSESEAREEVERQAPHYDTEADTPGHLQTWNYVSSDSGQLQSGTRYSFILLIICLITRLL